MRWLQVLADRRWTAVTIGSFAKLTFGMQRLVQLLCLRLQQHRIDIWIAGDIRERFVERAPNDADFVTRAQRTAHVVLAAADLLLKLIFQCGHLRDE